MTLVYLAAAWLAGVHFGLATSLPGALGITTGATTLALSLIWWRRPPARMMLLCAAVVAVAFWRGASAQVAPGPLDVANLTGTTLTLRGTVDEEAEVSHGSQRLLVRVEARLGEDGLAAAEGLVLATTPRFPEYDYGDVVVLSGRLESPPEFDGFSYRAYLARRGILSISRFPEIEKIRGAGGEPLKSALLRLRGGIDQRLRAVLGEPHAALASALLVGKRTNLPDDLVEAFRLAGVSHVLAVSGWQVTLVVGLLAGIGGSLLGGNHMARFLAAVLAVAGYVLLAGASPAVVRAGAMGGAALAAVALGRPRDGVSALALACFVMTAWNPLVLPDAGFQLSAVATLGLIVLSPRFTPVAARLPGWMGSVLAMTLAAELAVLPVLAVQFQQVSLVSLLANLVVVPAIPGGMEWAALAAILTSVWEPLGRLAATVASAYLGFAVWAVEWLGGAPFAAVSVSAPSHALVGAYYAALLLLADGGRRSLPLLAAARPLVPGWLSQRALVVAGAAALLAAGVLFVRPDGALRASFLDVGQGDSILIRTAQGRSVLVDGGPDGVAVQNALGRRLAVGSKNLDLLVLTHAHDDHLIGLIEVLQTHRIGQVLQGRPPARPSAAFRRWTELLGTLGVPVVEARTGQMVDLGGGARLRVLHAGEAWLGDDQSLNDSSLVLSLEQDQFTMLLLGDAGPAAQRWLLAQAGLPGVTALKLPHHGALGSLDERFVSTLQPQVALVSVGRDNRFGHPAAETLALLTGAEIYRTDLDGSIELRVDLGGGFSIHGSR